MANSTLSKDEILDAIGGMSVIELSELVEAFKEKFNVTIAAAAPAAAGAGPAAAVEEQTEFDVILKSIDAAKKIGIIKEVRAITGLGLAEAKKLTEDGGTIKEAANKEDAAKLKKQLEDAGAVIELK